VKRKHLKRRKGAGETPSQGEEPPIEILFWGRKRVRSIKDKRTSAHLCRQSARKRAKGEGEKWWEYFVSKSAAGGGWAHETPPHGGKARGTLEEGRTLKKTTAGHKKEKFSSSSGWCGTSPEAPNARGFTS